jgi:hypothetical protein
VIGEVAESMHWVAFHAQRQVQNLFARVQALPALFLPSQRFQYLQTFKFHFGQHY